MLDLERNKIGPAKVRHLAHALKMDTVGFTSILSYMHLYYLMQTLTTLNLARNEIGYEGAVYLANALKLNSVWLFSSLLYNVYLYHLI
jgi:hypothetical protein